MTLEGAAPSDLRVLMPYRLDYFARSMDTTLVTMWLAFRECCDMVFWGPGFPGWDPHRTLDDVAREVRPDIVLLPDLHHAEPGLWDDLLVGIERVTAPIVLFMSDPSSALDARREHLERLRPDAVLGLGPERGYDAYRDLLAALDCDLLLRPLGHDPDLFFAPDEPCARDIDVLVCGAVYGTAYPVRGRVKEAAASLASEWNVVDLAHPGYWECVVTSPTRRGQTAFADLLRRSRVVVTGTTYEILSAKYYEVAACGAVGVGDLPAQVGADDLRGAMLEVGPDDDVATIADAVRALLGDRERIAALSERALLAARGTGVVARARFTVDLLERWCDGRGLGRRAPAAARQELVDPLRVCVPADPAAPNARRDWHVVDGPGGELAGELRTLLRAAHQDVCVLAFDPDAATIADALLLGELARGAGAAGGIAIRHAAAGATRYERGFCCVAVVRSRLLEALDLVDGPGAIEAAVWMLLEQLPVVEVMPAGFDTPPVRARRACGAVVAGIEAARSPVEPALHHGRIRGARFARLDPSDPRSLDAIADLMRAGIAAPPIELGVPLRCGIDLDEAGRVLERHLERSGFDPELGSDVVVLERAFSEAELAWLEADGEAAGLERTA